METVYQRRSYKLSSLIRTNRLELNNVRTHVGSAAMRANLKFNRISAYKIITGFRKLQHPPTPFCLQSVKPVNLMADEATKSTQDTDKKGDENEAKKSPPPPPPPEKPLPGDCCGSGCVRCVWDVYYEELDEYNKLYKMDCDSNSKPS